MENGGKRDKRGRKGKEKKIVLKFTRNSFKIGDV